MSGQSIIDGLEEALAYMEGSAGKTNYNTHTGKLYAAPEHADAKDICKQNGNDKKNIEKNLRRRITMT